MKSRRLFGEDKSYLKLYQLENGYQFVSRKAKPVAEGNEAPDAVVMIARDLKGRLLIIKEHRPVVGGDIWALPAGLVESGENPIQTAIREIHEETGLNVIVDNEILEPILYPNNFSSPGMTDEKVAIVECFVEGELSDKNLEGDEKIVAYLMSPDDMLRAGLHKAETKMSIWLALILI